jgi:O-acetyl-ADP-ribose deacetylase (regulator of RNase III)
MTIYLLSWDQAMCDEWKRKFGPPVIVVLSSFQAFMKEHHNIDGVVSPANCFGMMDGSYDAAITEVFGEALMKDVQKKLVLEYCGIQPLASCISIPIRNALTEGGRQIYLLHTPVMTTPSEVREPELIYHAMRNTMMEAIRLNLECVVFPAWGGHVGCVEPYVIAGYMHAAYEQILKPNNSISWALIDETAGILYKQEHPNSVI